MNILKVDEQIIKSALSTGFTDFEDGIQYFCAIGSKKTNIIIARNTRDYKNADIPVMSPGDYLKSISR